MTLSLFLATVKSVYPSVSLDDLEHDLKKLKVDSAGHDFSLLRLRGVSDTEWIRVIKDNRIVLDIVIGDGALFAGCKIAGPVGPIGPIGPVGPSGG